MVQPIKKIFFSLLFCFIYATSSFAMADFLDIHVMDFTSKGKDEYILIFRAADTRECNKANMQKKYRKYIVHLRHNPEVLTIGIQKADENPYTKEVYLKAIDLFKYQLSKSKDLTIMRMSAKGYIHIKGKKGHYQTEALTIYSFKGQEYVCMIHSDL